MRACGDGAPVVLDHLQGIGLLRVCAVRLHHGLMHLLFGGGIGRLGPRHRLDRRSAVFGRRPRVGRRGFIGLSRRIARREEHG